MNFLAFSAFMIIAAIQGGKCNNNNTCENKLILRVVSGETNGRSRPVAGGGAGGAQAPSEIFRLESLLQKWNFSTKMDSCQWNLKFQSIVDHSKIMYCCSSVQFWNCVNERNRIFALPKTTNGFKITAY